MAKHTQHKYGEHHSSAAYEANRREVQKAADAAQRPSAPVPVKIRGIDVSQDAGFIMDSWCSSYRHSPVVGPIDPNLFKVEQRARLQRLLPKAKFLIACDPADERTIRGWICYVSGGFDAVGVRQLLTVHYICVRPELQGRGIATSLLDLAKKTGEADAPFWFTHWTHPMKRLATKWNGLFNPYLLEVSNPPDSSRVYRF